jgi:hypothetical protein
LDDGYWSNREIKGTEVDVILKCAGQPSQLRSVFVEFQWSRLLTDLP